jgi:hypothetical protein
VALRVVEGVRAGLAREAPDGGVVVFAITAPIRHPAKTIDALVRLLAALPDAGLRTVVHGNTVHACRFSGASDGVAGVFGFVHNPDCDGGLVLDLARQAVRPPFCMVPQSASLAGLD